MTQYANKDYWEDRYIKDKDNFEWYQSYAGIKDVITQYIEPFFQILNVGCGNSKLSEEMFKDGYKSITSGDISNTVVKQMNETYYTKIPELVFKPFDVR